VSAVFLTARQYSSGLIESFLSTVIFALSVTAVLKYAGDGTWKSLPTWAGQHRATMLFVVLAVIAVGVVGLVRSERTGLQLFLDLTEALFFFWAFAAIGAHLRSRQRHGPK
jgi:hypothetical protein